ncbi:MAG: ribosome maturation factor RimP [Pseudomonadota bacterium]
MRQASPAVHSVVAPAVSGLGYECLGIEMVSERGTTLRVYIDSPDGITIEDCEQASRQISAALDVEEPIQGEYHLEVSSPGLDRPLFTAEQFSRFIGETVRLKLAVPDVFGQRKFQGPILSVEDDEVCIDFEGEQRCFTMDAIDTARLVPRV